MHFISFNKYMKIAVKELKVKGIHCDPIKSEHYTGADFSHEIPQQFSRLPPHLEKI